MAEFYLRVAEFYLIVGEFYLIGAEYYPVEPRWPGMSSALRSLPLQASSIRPPPQLTKNYWPRFHLCVGQPAQLRANLWPFFGRYIRL